MGLSIAWDTPVRPIAYSAMGRRWCERIWTALATCAQQGRSAFDFLYDSIFAHLAKQPTPSLLPQPP